MLKHNATTKLKLLTIFFNKNQNLKNWQKFRQSIKFQVVVLDTGILTCTFN